MRRSELLPKLGPALLVGLVGLLVTVDLRVQTTASESSSARRAELARIVEARQRRTAQLERRLDELTTRLRRAAARSGPDQLRALAAARARIAPLSGLAPIEGEGVVVTLADAPGAEPDDPDLRIQDIDVQLAVNTLWGAGAEAIAVNGQRLVGTTAIRNAGAAVLVNYRVLTSPYRISAVGPAGMLEERFGASRTARRLERWQEIYGLGFRVEAVDRLRLPGYSGNVRYRNAKPIGDQG